MNDDWWSQFPNSHKKNKNISGFCWFCISIKQLTKQDFVHWSKRTSVTYIHQPRWRSRGRTTGTALQRTNHEPSNHEPTNHVPTLRCSTAADHSRADQSGSDQRCCTATAGRFGAGRVASFSHVNELKSDAISSVWCGSRRRICMSISRDHQITGTLWGSEWQLSSRLASSQTSLAQTG